MRCTVSPIIEPSHRERSGTIRDPTSLTTIFPSITAYNPQPLPFQEMREDQQLQQINDRLKKHESRIEELDRSLKIWWCITFLSRELLRRQLMRILDEQGEFAGCERLGGPSATHSKPRPLRLCFKTQNDKHEFLSHAKDMITKFGSELMMT